MDPTHSPFAVFTLIAAPALLTNATSVLALSTTNRMLRTRESMSQLLARSESRDPSLLDNSFMEQVGRVETQAGLLLGALHAIYLALGAFSGATLVTLMGAALDSYSGLTSTRCPSWACSWAAWAWPASSLEACDCSRRRKSP